MDTLAIATIAIGGFVFLLVATVIVRTKTGNKFEIKSSDIALALIPVALWLFLTGRVQKITVGDVGIEAAVKAAARAPVALQVTKLPVESVRMDPKGGLEALPAVISHKSEALSFRLGNRGYAGFAIRQYLIRLTKASSLRYLVITNQDGSFFGMADARQVATMIQETGGPITADRVAEWLNNSETAKLATLPGFVPSDNAVTPQSDKLKALQIMNSSDIQTLPVVDPNRQFVGIVDRSKLIASMLIDVTTKLEAESK